MVVSLVAVLKAGAAYVPLDPDYPAERLGYMLSSAEVGVLLRQQRLGERGGEYAGVVVEVDEEQERQRIESQSRENPGLRVESQHLAYIIYTSGSTGQPKGVMNSHGGLLNRLQWMQAEYQLGEQDVVLQKTPFSFDVSVWEFFWPLMMGAKLVVARPGGHQDPGYLAGLMEERGVTTVHFVPSMLGVFLEEERGQQCRSLKRVVCSGEALSAELARRCLGSMPWAELHNLYGPTEAAIDVTYWKCEAGDERGSVPIGRAIANMRVYVVDGRMETVPVGVAGELCLGGVGLARGYWGRGDLTGERFVPDGLSGKAGERLYRTGDLVRWQGDGTLEYLGRIDHQVKIRGFRIELGEIESALESHPGVKQAVVLAREDHPGEKRLVAYVVAGFDTQGSGTSELQINEIREYLKGKLPEYMVPNIYIWLEKLPLSPNGKIDRKALPAPDKEAYVRREYEAPVGEVETALAAIWADLLKVSQVGRHHNFFELGGHSLLAVSLIERMRTIGLHIDVRALFTTPTVAGLAAAAASDVDFVHVPENGVPAGCESIKPEMLSLIELSQGEIETIVSGVTGGASNVQEIYPLAPLQEGILFLHLMGEGSDPYVSGVLLSFDTRLGLDRYVDAMKTVIERHDILRTAVVWEGLREPVQVVWRKVSLLVEEVKLDPKAGDIGDQLYQRFDPRHYRIDVRRAPLIRLYIAYDEPNERWVAMMLRHHLTGDNTTVEVMLAEMEAHLLGRSELLPAPQQFRSLVARARLGANQEDHEAYFQKLLGDVDEPTAPFGLLDVQGDGSEIQEATISLDAALVRRMRERARKLGVSVAAICHVAWARVLASVSNREDVVFGTVLFGRMQGVAGSDRMMGLFINTLPVRIPINGQGAEASVLRTHQQLGELIRHEHVSLVVAQRCSSVQAPAPLFTSLLNYRHSLGGTIAPSAETEQAWQGVKWLRAEGRTNYPFGLSIEDGGMAFTLLVQTVGGIDPKRVCEYTRKALESLVESLEKEPEKAVRTLDVLSARERHQVLYDWNATTVAYPSHNCIHELFEEQVQKQPDAIAVMHEGASLNYSELNLRSNQLAHYLQGLGVKPEICVGICAERGFNMIVALLAVLKAGGVSVPLDPTHPTERLHSLLKDAAPAVLLTQAQLAKQFEPSLISLTLLDLDNSSLWADQPVNNLRPIGPPLLPARPAYVIYQSTSAGPNGIVVEHQGVLNLAWVHRQALNIGRDSRVLQFAPFCSDVSIWEIWMALSQGASLWIPPKNGELSGENLGQAIDHNEITHAILPLSALNGLPENAPLQTLNTVILTEENVGKAPARLRQSRHVMNAYGVTAATVCATLHACGLQEEGRSVIGRPVENTQVYILDGQQQPVPAEAIGEIYIGGAGVARGYLNAPELTANHFVPDPSSAKPGARMYKTGDRGRWRKDGAIEFMGRGRSQARVCGFRIDLGEIEAALQEHKQIRQAVIIAREESEGNVRLVAYVVPIEQAASANENSAAAFEVSELREHVRRKLPEHMVPGTYIQLDNLPLIASGKIDRNKLLQMDSEASGQKQAGPSTPAEEALVQIWQEILELERVGIHDNFFEIGGNSLTAVLVGVRVQESFNVDVPLRALFESPTVAKMARQLAGINQGQGASGTPSVVVSIQPEGSRAPFFCVHAIGGQVFGYADFSQELGLEQPFYGLQSPPPDYFPESSVSLEQIASLYNKEIRSVQPCGPYMLGGWSMGGLVAWEMAQQLIKEGETVGLLALIDTALPAPYRDADDRDEDISILGRFALEMSRLIGRDPRPLAEQFLKSAPEDQWNMVEQALTEYGLLSAKNAHADMTALLNIFTRNFQAMNSYSMNSIDLPVLFFRASETMEHLSRKWTQWAAEGIEIHSVPGDHFTILRRPNVRVIVDILQRSLSMANEQPQRAVSAEM
jgi:amino acid adenylation domain-containing protein